MFDLQPADTVEELKEELPHPDHQLFTVTERNQTVWPNYIQVGDSVTLSDPDHGTLITLTRVT